MVDLHDDSINLRALRKIDDSIKEIKQSAGQVAIYYFNVDDDVWKRKDIEGPLFFVQRSIQPEYAFVVINRLNTINLVQKITKDLETNIQTPYLMYKNTENEIYCVWFYEKENIVTLNEKIVDIIDKLKKNKLFSNSINQFNEFNGLNANASNSAQTNSDLLKMMLSVEKNPQDPIKENKILQPQAPSELVKPIAQRRSVNLKDLFESQLTVSNNSAESNNSTKIDGDTAKLEQALTPNQFLKDEKSKKSQFASPKVTNIPTTNDTEVNDSKLKSPFETLLSHPKLNKNRKSADSENPLYLSMEQLKKTLIYLLQNDADFLHTIHTAYVTEIKK